jgi:hypothetical protein
MKKFLPVIIVCSIISISPIVLADDFQNMLRNLQSSAQGAANSNNSKHHIPGYDAGKIAQEEQRLNSINHGALEAEGTRYKVAGEDCMANPSCTSGAEMGAGIASRTSDRPPLLGYENLDLFKTADEIYADPMKILSSLSEKECRESANKTNPGFKTVKTIITHTEDIVEKQQCEIPKTTLNCEKTLVLGCVDMHDCDYGGVVKGTVASDVQFEFRNGELLIGNQNYAGWGGSCAVYDRITTFELKNIKQIKEFRLIHVRFDDYIQVDINGHTIFAGPDAGATKAEVEVIDYEWFGKIKVVNDGTGQHKNCERNTDWHRAPNIDLIPYIKEGQNNIRFKVITTGRGTGSLKIRAKQNCCNEWREEWSKRCWAE